MRIDGMSSMGIGIQQPMGQGTDAESKNIQNQIKAKQEELQKLSENNDMSLEEKMKKRQKLQQEIADLNNQLRQHQMEMRQEQKNSKSSMDDLLGGNSRPKAKSTDETKGGMSTNSMQAMISADSSMKMADVKNSIAIEMKGTAGILESEIKQDKVLGVNTEKKEKDLADIKERTAEVTASQISDLDKATKTMQEAAKADADGEDSDEKKDKSADKEDKENAAAIKATEGLAVPGTNVDVQV